MLQQVALGIDAELRRRGLVAPLDAALLVEQHHAVGRGLDGGQEFLQPVLGLAGLLFAVAQQLADALGQFAPHADAAAGQPTASLRRICSSRLARQPSKASQTTAPPQAPIQPSFQPKRL